MADAQVTCAFRGERHEFRSRRDRIQQALRLLLESDAYLAQVAYRLEVALRRRGVPVLPRLAHAVSVVAAQVDIGPDVVVGPGLYLAHGQVSIRGAVDVDRRVVMFPWATLAGGSSADEVLRIDPDARIGTGAVVEGPFRIGGGARIGANAVVEADVPAGAYVAGVPAAPVR